MVCNGVSAVVNWLYFNYVTRFPLEALLLGLPVSFCRYRHHKRNKGTKQ